MRIWAISDLHGMLPDSPKAGECDIAVVAGDVCPDYTTGVTGQMAWVERKLKPWLASFPCPVYLTAGNHDFLFFMWWDLKWPLPEWLKIDRVVEFQGVRFFFTPWSICPPGWAFRIDEDYLRDRTEHWPTEIDVIVSHGPPEGPAGKSYEEQLGHRALHRYAVRSGARLVICGHIHEARGSYVRPEYWTQNVSYVDRLYRPVYEPVIIEVEDGNDGDD